MARLEVSKALHRKIRKDDISELPIPTWLLVSKAIKAGKTKEALDLLEYATDESTRNSDVLVSFIEMVITRLASFGEDEIMKIIHDRYYESTREWLSVTHGMEEILQRCSESQRGHHADFTITEEADKYVVRYDPCGSGGRLRRTRPVGVTKEAHPWSWGKAGVPYYCCHCCIHWEIIPTELQGYPVRVNLLGEKPDDPCIHLFYKKPELIPEKYFRRIGMAKGC